MHIQSFHSNTPLYKWSVSSISPRYVRGWPICLRNHPVFFGHLSILPPDPFFSAYPSTGLDQLCWASATQGAPVICNRGAVQAPLDLMRPSERPIASNFRRILGTSFDRRTTSLSFRPQFPSGACSSVTCRCDTHTAVVTAVSVSLSQAKSDVSSDMIKNRLQAAGRASHRTH